MLDAMKAVIEGNDMCVLATVSDTGPYCSLMFYTTDEECREIYMMTQKGTKKYRNIKENSSVSMLIDTRLEDADTSPGTIRAMTVTGSYKKLNEDGQHLIRMKLLERHPHLRAIAHSADTEVFAVRIESLLLLDGVTESHFEILE
jgi:nitroimidazol reductase NimA-like FMN-containing flavoprotein (pyridoxamine 5'-phosphate oxidase superfamily)